MNTTGKKNAPSGARWEATVPEINIETKNQEAGA